MQLINILHTLLQAMNRFSTGQRWTFYYKIKMYSADTGTFHRNDMDSIGNHQVLKNNIWHSSIIASQNQWLFDYNSTPRLCPDKASRWFSHESAVMDKKWKKPTIISLLPLVSPPGGGAKVNTIHYLFRSSKVKTQYKLEWTIIFGLKGTKIYLGHMSSIDFCGGYIFKMSLFDVRKWITCKNWCLNVLFFS